MQHKRCSAFLSARESWWWTLDILFTAFYHIFSLLLENKQFYSVIRDNIASDPRSMNMVICLFCAIATTRCLTDPYFNGLSNDIIWLEVSQWKAIVSIMNVELAFIVLSEWILLRTSGCKQWKSRWRHAESITKRLQCKQHQLIVLEAKF